MGYVIDETLREIDLLTVSLGYKYFVSSDAGATDRLFKNFLTCGVNDFGCVTEQCLTAGNDVEVGRFDSSYKSVD